MMRPSVTVPDWTRISPWVRAPLMVPVAVTSPWALTVSRGSTLLPPLYRPNVSAGGSPPTTSTGWPGVAVGWDRSARVPLRAATVSALTPA